MKTLIGVRCSGWNRPEFVEVEIPESATEEEREQLMREAAIEQAHFEFLEARHD